MFNKTNPLPSTLEEQYNASYFSKEEYISRLAIDLVMSGEVLELTHDNKKSFAYSKKDLIEESAHLEWAIEAMFIFSEMGGNNTSYNNNLIAYADECLEHWIDSGYKVAIA